MSDIFRDLIESFGYDIDDSILKEYDLNSLKGDISDFEQGVESGISAGYAPEVKAAIRAATGNTAYNDALAREKETWNKNQEVAKQRSPWLYNAGSIAPAAALGGIPGALLGVGSAVYGRDTLANPFANDTNSGDGVLPSEEITNMIQPSVSELQSKLKYYGIDIGTPTADGKFGPKTATAVNVFQKKSGAPTFVDAIAHLMGIPAQSADSPNAAEPVNESEKMANLRNMIERIDEGGVASALGSLAKGALNLSKKSGGAVSKGALAGAAILPKMVGPVLKFAWNHKFLSLLAGLVAYNFTIGPDGNLETSNGGAVQFPDTATVDDSAHQTNQQTNTSPDGKWTIEKNDDNRYHSPNFATVLDLQKELRKRGYPVSLSGTMDQKTRDAKEWEFGSDKMKGSEEIRTGLDKVIKDTTPPSVAEDIASFRDMLDNLSK